MGRRKGQPHGPFSSPALARTALADLLAHVPIPLMPLRAFLFLKGFGSFCAQWKSSMTPLPMPGEVQCCIASCVPRRLLAGRPNLLDRRGAARRGSLKRAFQGIVEKKSPQVFDQKPQGCPEPCAEPSLRFLPPNSQQFLGKRRKRKRAPTRGTPPIPRRYRSATIFPNNQQVGRIFHEEPPSEAFGG